jgi:hypothetical protein
MLNSSAEIGHTRPHGKPRRADKQRIGYESGISFAQTESDEHAQFELAQRNRALWLVESISE